MGKIDTSISKTAFERLLNKGIVKMPEHLLESNGGKVPAKAFIKDKAGFWLRKHDLKTFIELYETWLKKEGVGEYEISKGGIYYRK